MQNILRIREIVGIQIEIKTLLLKTLQDEREINYVLNESKTKSFLILKNICCLFTNSALKEYFRIFHTKVFELKVLSFTVSIFICESSQSTP